MVAIGLVASGLVASGAVGLGAAGVGFKGRTSQKQPISFRVSGGSISQLDYRIVDRCPHHQRLINHDFGFSAIRISHSRFGGTFVDPRHHTKAIVQGMTMAATVRGSLSDRTRNPKTHAICTGKATFKLHR